MTVELDLPTPTWAGTSISTTASFKPPGASKPIDPTTVECWFRQGTGSWTTWTYQGTGSIVRQKQGQYFAQIPTDGSPTIDWEVKWVGTGVCAVVEVATFPVTAQP